MKEERVFLLKHFQMYRSFQKHICQNYGVKAWWQCATATSSALEAAPDYCRPAFLNYPNMPTANTYLNFSHNDFGHRSTDFIVSQMFFLLLPILPSLDWMPERLSDDKYMTDLHTINDVPNFHPLPNGVRGALQCHLRLVPVAEEWQRDNNKQPCISMRRKEKTNPFQFFKHTLNLYILAKHKLVWCWEGHVRVFLFFLQFRVRLCGFLHRIYWRA